MLFSLLAVYALILIAAILFGANLARWFVLTHTRTQLIMSFVSGLMLGIAIFHLLPHAVYSIDTTDSLEIAVRWLMAGLLAMFMLLRVFHFHHHDLAEDAHDAHCVDHSTHLDSHQSGVSSAVPIDVATDEPSINGVQQSDALHSSDSQGSLSWFAVALGLTIHTVVDGVALAASMQAEAAFGDAGGLTAIFGLGVFLAILLHKPLDALTISAVMNLAGVSSFVRWIVLVGYALICPLVAGLILWGVAPLASSGLYVGAALAFSSGVFICIALSDLLPEVHFHSHDKVKMTMVLLMGIGLALLIVSIEPEGRHHGTHSVNQSLFSSSKLA